MKKFLAILLLLPLNLWATEYCTEEACFSEELVIGDTKFKLQNAVDYSYLIFDVYSIGLYTADDSENVLDHKKSKVLVFKYHRDIKREQLIEAADKTLMKDPAYDGNLFKAELDRINQAYSDVRENDSYTLVYTPKDGVGLFQDGEKLVDIDNKDFASTYYGIWLSQYSLSQKLTEDLLKPREVTP